MTSDRPFTDSAVTGAARVIANALPLTVIEEAVVVPRFVVPLRSDTDAALALHAGFTPVKLTPVTRYSWAAES